MFEGWFFGNVDCFYSGIDYELEHPGSWQCETFQETNYPELMPCSNN